MYASQAGRPCLTSLRPATHRKQVMSSADQPIRFAELRIARPIEIFGTVRCNALVTGSAHPARRQCHRGWTCSKELGTPHLTWGSRHLTWAQAKAAQFRAGAAPPEWAPGHLRVRPSGADRSWDRLATSVPMPIRGAITARNIQFESGSNPR